MRKLGSYTHSCWVNRALKAALFATAFIGLFAQGTDAATITVNPPDIYGRTFVDVVGDFAAGDDKTFLAKVGRPAEPEKVIVTLMSNGGHGYPPLSSATSSASPAWQHTYQQTKRVQVRVRLCGWLALSAWWAGAPKRISASMVFMMRQPDSNWLCPMSYSPPILATLILHMTQSCGCLRPAR